MVTKTKPPPPAARRMRKAGKNSLKGGITDSCFSMCKIISYFEADTRLGLGSELTRFVSYVKLSAINSSREAEGPAL